MYYAPYSYSNQNPSYGSVPLKQSFIQPHYRNPYPVHQHVEYFQPHGRNPIRPNDYGKRPFVININEATKQNNYYRSALWTGDLLQLTLMSINPGEDIGLEIHPDVDQFLRVEQGQGVVQMGHRKDHLNFVQQVQDDSAIFIPARTWHNVTNTGDIPLKLYSIYAPPNHPFGTIHPTKADAMAAEQHTHSDLQHFSPQSIHPGF